MGQTVPHQYARKGIGGKERQTNNNGPAQAFAQYGGRTRSIRRIGDKEETTLSKILETIAEQGMNIGELTFGDCIAVAKAAGVRVSEVIIAEAAEENKMQKEEVASALIAKFHHNIYAVDIGTTTGKSFLFNTVGREMVDENAIPVVDDKFVNLVVAYTLGAQVGNHSVGLMPCAGTGDSTVYTGFIKAMLTSEMDQDVIVRVAAVMLKLGTIFRVGKTSTGCNMEGFGAGAAASAAAFVEMANGTPEQMERAVVIAMSPTVGVPCTPRVMVPGLCATHIGGAVMIGKLASGLALHTSLPVNVPVDVMITLGAAAHQASAKHIVPTVVEYMEPFFRTNVEVEGYVSPKVKEEEAKRIESTIKMASEQAHDMARKARTVIDPFGDAVVGGSSQAVGSPTNTGRIAHYLAKGDIKKITIELYPELFARRGINVPGILMAAAYGAGTDNGKMYHDVMDKVKQDGIEVEILMLDEPQVQKVTIEATERSSMVKALNRGGARLVLKEVSSSMEEATAVAEKLGIDLCE